MGFLMCGMRGQLGAHDEHDAEGMHFLNNVTDVRLGTSLRVYQVSAGRKSVGNTHNHDSEDSRVTADLHHETAPSRSLPVH